MAFVFLCRSMAPVNTATTPRAYISPLDRTLMVAARLWRPLPASGFSEAANGWPLFGCLFCGIWCIFADCIKTRARSGSSLRRPRNTWSSALDARSANARGFEAFFCAVCQIWWTLHEVVGLKLASCVSRHEMGMQRSQQSTIGVFTRGNSGFKTT